MIHIVPVSADGSKCHRRFSRQEVAGNHMQSCRHSISGQIEIKLSEWTTHWPEDLKEPPLHDPLREYYEKFTKKNAKDEGESEQDEAEPEA